MRCRFLGRGEIGPGRGGVGFGLLGHGFAEWDEWDKSDEWESEMLA